jgi:transposase InsO family protein
VAPNLLNRTFSPGAPRRAWGADILDIPTDEGWLYLAVVLDLFSLKVLAWAMRDHMRTERPLAALRILMAAFVPGINHLRKKRVGPKPPFH